MSKIYAFRLKPGDDLKKGIQSFVTTNNMQAGCITCCVGSLTHYTIRFANRREGSSGSGHFEILSLNGTVSVNGSHLHISLSESEGQTIGGHLLDNNIIYTTAEIIIYELDDLIFTRETDNLTDFKKLKVNKR